MSLGFLTFARLGVDTSYAYVLVCVVILVAGISLTMSPMTATIMSAVPPRIAHPGGPAYRRWSSKGPLRAGEASGERGADLGRRDGQRGHY